MSTEPAKVNTNKTNTAAPEPKAKDKFLARLVEVFGAQKGVALYQKDNSTEKELEDFITLAEKFEVNPRLLKQ